MGATTFYGWPYPDPGSDVDVPRDIKALADELETMKNGLTVPSGNIVAGSQTGGSLAPNVAVYGQSGADTVAFQLGIGNADRTSIIFVKNGAEVNRISVESDGAVKVLKGGQYRPIPFAVAAGRANLVQTGATAITATVSLPSNRFTTSDTGSNVPIVHLTPNSAAGNHFALYDTVAYGVTKTGFTIRAGSTVGITVDLPVFWIAMQMTPTSGPGLFVSQADEPNHPERMVTCHVEGCDNDNVPITLLQPEDSQGMICGPCGNPIEDMTARKKVRK